MLVTLRHELLSIYPSPVGGGGSPPGESSILETGIKNIIVTDPTIHQRYCQQTPNNTLVQLSTKAFCQQVGDKTCISAERNFKTLFAQTTQNASGDWVSNGEVQNVSPDSLKLVLAMLHLYDCSGRIVGYTEGFTVPYNLTSMQPAGFNLTISPANVTGTPKFFRVSFDFANATGENITSAGSNATLSNGLTSGTGGVRNSGGVMFAGTRISGMAIPSGTIRTY